MIDFTLGVIVGCIITVTIWHMLDTKTITVNVIAEEKPPVPVVIKPDNKKAAFYSSAEYRNELQFVKESKKQ